MKGDSNIGGYRVVSQLGRGGMGEVWLAEHALIGRRAAIKLLKPGLAVSDEMVSRFFNEARAAAAIADPGIVQIFDFGYHTDGSAYIVMELLEGETLDQHLGVMSLADALLVMRQVASALGAAHARNIIHRDIKPENLFLVRDPEVPGGRRAKILDFGIAKLNGDPSAQLTHTQALIGTPLYMSPEQCRGAGQVDQRTDIYSLGCVMFELIVGEPPFTGEGVGDVIAKHLREPAPRVDGVPTDVADLIARCLAKDPRERFATGGDLALAIGALLSRGVGLAPRMAPSSPALAMTAPPSAMLPAVRSSTAMAAVRGSSTLPAVRPSSTLATPPPPARPSARPMTPPPTQAQPVFAASANALPVFSATAAPVFEPRANTTLSSSVVVTETPPAGTGIDKRVVGALAGVAVAGAAIAFFVVHSSSSSSSSTATPTTSPSTATVAAAAPIAPAPRPAAPSPADRLTAVAIGFQLWANDHRGAGCPSGRDLAPRVDGGLLDAWGHDVAITCTDQPDGQVVGIVSAGPDGAFGTGDDLASWKLEAVAMVLRGPRWTAVVAKPVAHVATPPVAAKPAAPVPAPVAAPKPAAKPAHSFAGTALGDDGIPTSR